MKRKKDQYLIEGFKKKVTRKNSMYSSKKRQDSLFYVLSECKKKTTGCWCYNWVKPVYRWPKRWRPSDYPIKRKFVLRSSPLQFWAAISTIWESFQRKHIVVLLSWIRSAFMSQSELLKAWASSSKCINNKIWSILIAPNEAKSRLRSAGQPLNAGKSPKSTSAPAI